MAGLVEAGELEPRDRARRAGALALGLAIFLLALLYAHGAPLDAFVGDDGAITLRYAERIAEGRGFSYNDGEAVNGCSNPLYTLAVAGLLRAGLEPADAVRWIAVLCFALSCGVVASTFARFRTVGGALFAAFALCAFARPLARWFWGLEVPLTSLLAALYFRALHARRAELWCGVVLGLLVANKLDGALAALGFAAAFCVARRRFPWRATAAALASALPVLAWVQWSFGSVLPHSMTTKLFEHGATHQGFDPLWMHRLLEHDFRWVHYLALASIVLVPLHRRGRARFAVIALQAWLVLHLVAYAAIDLGAPYPWYAAVPDFLEPLLAAVAVELVVERIPGGLRAAGRRFLGAFELDPARAGRLGAALAFAAALVALGASSGSSLLGRLDRAGVPGPLARSAAGDLARQSAGAWLRKHTSATELFATGYGLPAYEYGGPVLDLLDLNSERAVERRESAMYELNGPLPAAAPPAWKRGRLELTATFLADGAADLYALYASPESELARGGAVHFELLPAGAFVGERGAQELRRLAARGASLEVGARDVLQLAYQSPRPLALRLNARVTPVAGAEPDVRSARMLCARFVGGRALRVPLRVGAAPMRIDLPAPERCESGRYFAVFELEGAEAGLFDGALRVSEPELRAGDPLGASDFKLRWDRASDRIEHIAREGLPFGELAR